MYTIPGHRATDLAHPPGQGARIQSDGTAALGPITLDTDWIARTQGWADDAERQQAYILAVACGARIVTNRDAVDDPVLASVDILDGLEDRIATGDLMLPGTPVRAAVASLLVRASRAVWANVQRARDRGYEEVLGESEADLAHRVAERTAA